jgi:hypothetical protein
MGAMMVLESRAMATAVPPASKTRLELALLRAVGFSDDEVAAVVGADAEAIGRWRAGSDAPAGERAARLGELAALVQRLTATIQPEAIAPWLRKPLQVLDGKVPLRVIADGGYERVSGLVAELETFSVS